MAIINRPLDFSEAKGVFSDGLVFGSWRGINYVRRAWVQPYTNSTAQKRNRGQFAEAVKAYQGLDCQARKNWQQLARELDYSGSGYNLFISRYLERSRKD
ncbi:MAG: hypothetical protein ABR596_08850 [Halarsenatibacteraceae bacterium]